MSINHFDVLALRALLRGDQDEVDRLYQLAGAFAGEHCPQCGERDIAANAHGDAFVCLGCDHHWEQEDITL